MLPRKGAAQDWLGKTVVDRDGAVLGVCTQAVPGPPGADWIVADVEGTARHLPASGAVLSGGVLRVTVTRGEVESAPTAGTSGVITVQEGEALTRHYAIASSGTVDTVPADKNGNHRTVVTVAALAGLGALVGAAVQVLALRRRRRQQRASRLARLARLVAGGSALASSALLPTFRTGARMTARAAARAGEAGATAATHGARGAAEAARAGLVPLATTAAALTTKGASAAVGALGEVSKGGFHGAQAAGGAVASVSETVAEQGHELHEQWRKTVRTVKFVLALAVGYVLGARDGRERFEQLKRAATNVAQRPEVQDAKDRLTKAGEGKLARGQQGQPRSSSPTAGPVDGAPAATTSTSEARRDT